MQHLENDMDDLFQRAGENYPLQTDKGDWESIAGRINDNTKDAALIPSPGKKKNKKFIPLILLLLILSAGTYRAIINKIPSAYTGNDLSKEINKKPGRAGGSNNNTGIVVEIKQLINAPDKVNRSAGSKNNVSSFSNNPVPVNTRNAGNYFFSKLPDRNVNNPGSDRVTLIEINNNSNSYNFLEQHDLKDTVADETGGSFKINADNIPGKNQLIAVELKQPEKKKNNITAVENKKKETAGILQKKKGLYFGLIAGPDFSKVREKSYRGGFDAGLVLGYRPRGKLSFETGFLWNKKHYSSEGKNFSMDKVSSTMPSGMIINNIESNSSLIEIPVKVKYDFMTKRNSGLFVAGGISSYIITKEKNLYGVTMNGNQEKVTGVYEKNGYGIPAVATMSLGYEYNVSGYLNIRIEPYLKIPLQGMGVGSLPVTSAGFQVGIIGRFR